MKRWISVLAVLVALLMLTLPTSANTIEKLQEIYNNLSAYMYEPYFEKSESFTEYKEAFEELKAFLKEDTTPTQKEISHHYQRMKAAFSALMLETFDYSEIVAQAETYQTMDSFLFTSVSWEKLVSAADTIIRELDSPMLFTRNPNTSFDEYSAVVQNHIRSLSNAFTDAYNELEMVLPEINVTKQQLGALAKHAEIPPILNPSSPPPSGRNTRSALTRLRRWLSYATQDKQGSMQPPPICLRPTRI